MTQKAELRFLPGIPPITPFPVLVRDDEGDTVLECTGNWKTLPHKQRSALMLACTDYFNALDDLARQSFEAGADIHEIEAATDRWRDKMEALIRENILSLEGCDYSLDDMLPWDNYLFGLALSLYSVARGFRLKNSIASGMHGARDTSPMLDQEARLPA